jgi:hypothetical protein
MYNVAYRSALLLSNSFPFIVIDIAYYEAVLDRRGSWSAISTCLIMGEIEWFLTSIVIVESHDYCRIIV